MKIKYLAGHSKDLAASAKPLVIFDFDGTLCDSMALSVAIFNGLASRFQLPVMSVEALRQERLRDLLARSGLRWYTLPRLIRAVKKALKLQLPTLLPFAETRDCLAELREGGYTFGILTSNSLAITEAFLAQHRLPGFAFICAGASLFGKGPLLAKFLAKHRLGKDEVVYVGDETRDVEAMAQVGVPMIAVSWGWNSRALLSSSQPDYLVDSHAELLKVLQSLARR